jgi:hypothetical protein
MISCGDRGRKPLRMGRGEPVVKRARDHPPLPLAGGRLSPATSSPHTHASPLWPLDLGPLPRELPSADLRRHECGALAPVRRGSGNRGGARGPVRRLWSRAERGFSLGRRCLDQPAGRARVDERGRGSAHPLDVAHRRPAVLSPDGDELLARLPALVPVDHALPSRKPPPACGGRGPVLAAPAPAGGAGSRAGRGDLRPASADGAVRRLDHRAEEHAFAGAVPWGPARVWPV